MTIRELVTKLGFQIDDGTIKKYEKKVDDVKKKSEQLSNAISGIGRAISVIGGAVAAAGFGALGKSILETTGGTILLYRISTELRRLLEVCKEWLHSVCKPRKRRTFSLD